MCDHHKKPKKSSKQRHGSALEHGEAHAKDHQKWSRRLFLRNLGIAGSASLMLGKLPVTALAASPLSAALNNSDSERILVLIRLKGGNDGLNTIIPIFDYGTYQARRPTIAIPEDQIIGLNDAFGVPNTMGALENMWLDGQMKVVNSVGYPDQNLSHFRSSDIWSSGSNADVNDSSGWLGRFLGNEFPDFITNPPECPPAIQIGGTGNVVFNNSDLVNMGVIVNDPQELFEIAQRGQLYDATDVPECYYGEQLGFMRTVANSTFKYAEVIANSYETGMNSVEYQYNIGEQLALVARLIKGGLGTQLYMVTLDGFDTHAGQNNTHPFLLLSLSNAVKAFYDDLAEGGFDQKVLSMTFSEFGRRIEQNASAGTDHGAAAPLLLFGAGLNGSAVLGQAPNLQDVDEVGNLKYGTDFREIYATVLENWLCVDGTTVDGIMGQSFNRMADLGIQCGMTTSTASVNAQRLEHRVAYSQGQVTIFYNLAESMPITIQVYNLLGQPVSTLYNGHQIAGSHQVTFQTSNTRLSNGYYIYSIKAGRQVYSNKIQVIR